jgi:predicted metal-dependent phosphoesterase TrpH
MIKVELHAHTSDDPGDRIPHSTEALLARAAALGYGALAITLHNRWFDPGPWDRRARPLGVTLVSGIEKGIEGRHVLAINVPREVEQARTFDDLRAIKRRAPQALIVAPHPFYPIASALGSLMDDLTDLLDQLGTTWTEVDSAPDAEAICAAIKAGRVEVRTAPLSWARAIWTMTRMELGGWGRADLR